MISGKFVTIPVISESRKQAVLEIQLTESTPPLDERTMRVVEAVVHSLALYLDNLDAEENKRLANLGAMAAAIVHDLRNPIGVIMNYAQMADDEDIGKETRTEYLQAVYLEAMRMSEMAQEVLTFSKGDIKLEINRIQANLFYEDVLAMLQPLFTEDGITLDYDFQYKGYLQFDINRIRRVIYNLANNAKDALLTHTVSPPCFRLEILTREEGLVIRAVDNGPGIPKQIQATLFEPFVTHGKNYGTGLGMAIVKKIINAHDGTVTFETGAETGTTFTIFIPMDLAALAAYRAAQEGRHERSEIRHILIVDDNPTDRRRYRSYLENLDFQIDEAANGRQAIQQLTAASGQQAPFDVIIIEKILPGMDGKEITTAIQKIPELSKTRRIMLTDEGKRGDLEQAEKLGFSAYLTKPVEKKQLLECLQLVLKAESTTPIITRYQLAAEKKKTIRILIADDNILNQKLILTHLKKAGYGGDVVSNGKEVLEALKKKDYSIVLLDVAMPVMDGVEAARRIRSSEGGTVNRNVPIVGITAYTQDEEIHRFIESGMNECVTKPIDRDRLIAAIEKHL